MNTLMINIGMLLITYPLVNAYYYQFDSVYKCSEYTHIFGLVLPLLYMFLLYRLETNGKISKGLDRYLYYITLFLSASMFNFHLSYELDKK